jgi:hypothetical protein
MKFSLLLFLLFLPFLSRSQSAPYDLPFDFNQITCKTDPDSLVGQEIYFFPRNQMFQGAKLEKDTILYGFISEKKTPLMSIVPEKYKTDVLNGRWSIMDISNSNIYPFLSGDTSTHVYKPIFMQNAGVGEQFILLSPYSAFEDKLFKIIACTDSFSNIGMMEGTCFKKFTLKDPQGQIIHWKVNTKAMGTYTVCIKSFITYLRSHVTHRKMYIRKESWVPAIFYNQLDGTMYETIPGKELNCDDMTMFNIRDHIFPQLALMMTDSDQKQYIVDPGNSVIPQNPLTLSMLWNEDQYNDYLKREKKVHDSLVKARNIIEKRMIAAYPSYVQLMKKKYGKEMGMHVVRKEVVPGMTKEMCITAWNDEHSIGLYPFKGQNIEVWRYSLYRYLVFKGDKLVRFNE